MVQQTNQNPQKPIVQTPLWTLVLFKIQFGWSCVPLFLWCRRQVYCFPTKFQPQVSTRDRHVDKCIHTTRAPCFGWSKAAMYGAQSKLIKLRRLFSWTESNFMIRNHSTAAVQGLIISDVNFYFSCFVHNHRSCFLPVWCPIVFASLGHHVLLKSDPQDTLSQKMLKNVQCCTCLTKIFEAWSACCPNTSTWLLHHPNKSAHTTATTGQSGRKSHSAGHPPPLFLTLT